MRRYQNQSKKVLVRNGVDINKQILGNAKGEYFTGNLERHNTCYVKNPGTRWRVVIDNLNTKERSYWEFTSQMWIGRTGGGQNCEIKMTVAGDGRVSRNHCKIYEGNGILYLQDLNSKNHTFLNGTILTEAACLHNGDVIQVGDTQLRIQFSAMNQRL